MGRPLPGVQTGRDVAQLSPEQLVPSRDGPWSSSPAQRPLPCSQALPGCLHSLLPWRAAMVAGLQNVIDCKQQRGLYHYHAVFRGTDCECSAGKAAKQTGVI